MKASLGGTGSLVPAVAAVAGSVALSLLILHPPPAELLPWSAPADRGHVEAVILPAAHVSRPAANPQLERLRPTSSEVAALTPPPKAASPLVSRPHRRPTPPEQVPPTPVTQPVTTPVVTPPTVTPTATTSNGRWSTAKTKTWTGAATKQSTRTQKGKPPWAGPKHAPPAAAATPAAPTQAAPDESKTPPGQDKTKTPPGQVKKAK